MGPFWAQKFKNANLTKSFIKMFLKFFATIGIQNEAKVTVFFNFQENFDYAQRTPLSTLLVTKLTRFIFHV